MSGHFGMRDLPSCLVVIFGFGFDLSAGLELDFDALLGFAFGYSFVAYLAGGPLVFLKNHLILFDFGYLVVVLSVVVSSDLCLGQTVGGHEYLLVPFSMSL